MVKNSDHLTQSITESTRIVKISNNQGAEEYPRAVKKNGRYVLPWKTENQPPDSFTNFKYFFTLDGSKVPGEDKLNEEPLMQPATVDPARVENPPENGIRTTWLGHASVLFQLDNANILVNPNFNERGIKYYHPGDNKRYRNPVYKIDDLPRIDCVFITNTHFDYLDLSSIRLLNERFGEFILYYVPQGVADWMYKAGCTNVVELDWWKEDEVDFIDHREGEDEYSKTTTFNIACTPSQSYHSRDVDDDNGMLWCSWVVMSPRYRIFISGATGYNDKVFKSIGSRYGPFHMAALPIGGYCPAWKFAYGNVTPEESVQIHLDVKSLCSLAVSWGTFSNSNEFYLEPPQRLNEELKKRIISEMQFFFLRHGESRLIEIQPASAENKDWELHHQRDSDLNGNGHVAHGHENGSLEKEDNGIADQDNDFGLGEIEANLHLDTEVHAHVDVDVDLDVDVESHCEADQSKVTITYSETEVVPSDDLHENTHVESHCETEENDDGSSVLTYTETVTTTVDGDGDIHTDTHTETVEYGDDGNTITHTETNVHIEGEVPIGDNVLTMDDLVDQMGGLEVEYGGECHVETTHETKQFEKSKSNSSSDNEW